MQSRQTIFHPWHFRQARSSPSKAQIQPRHTAGLSNWTCRLSNHHRPPLKRSSTTPHEWIGQTPLEHELTLGHSKQGHALTNGTGPKARHSAPPDIQHSPTAFGTKQAKVHAESRTRHRTEQCFRHRRHPRATQASYSKQQPRTQSKYCRSSRHSHTPNRRRFCTIILHHNQQTPSLIRLGDTTISTGSMTHRLATALGL
jgi:hypothetical protein